MGRDKDGQKIFMTGTSRSFINRYDWKCSAAPSGRLFIMFVLCVCMAVYTERSCALALHDSKDVFQLQVELVEYAAYGDTAGVSRAVQRGADVNMRCPNTGRSALSVASENNHRQTVIYLLERGADVDLQDLDTGATPLYMAASTSAAEAMSALIKAGADLDLPSFQEASTPLIVAITFGYHDRVADLIEAGADPAFCDYFGISPLGIAVQKSDINSVRLLLRSHVDVNGRDQRGFVPLHMAVYNGDLSMVLALLDAGADPSVRDGYGRNSLEIALISGHSDIYRYIRGNYPDVRPHSVSGMDVFELLHVYEANGQCRALIMAGDKLVYANESHIEKNLFRVIEIMDEAVLILDFRTMTERLLWVNRHALLKCRDNRSEL